MLRVRPESPESERPWLTRERALALVLIAATLVAFYLCFALASPFLPAIAWAFALAVVAHPLHRWLERRIGYPNVAAVLSVVIVAIVLLVPTWFVVQNLVQQVAAKAGELNQEQIAERWQAAIDSNPRLAPAIDWLNGQFDVRGEAGRIAAALTDRARRYLTGSLWIAAQMLITLFLLFYMLRDRRLALSSLRHVVPLSRDESDGVFSRVEDTIYATVYGSLMVAAIQGTLGGLIFWMLGLPAPLIWGVVMALLAVVPMLGTFVVWLPTAIYLALTGEWGKALILVAWGAIVIALIDNFVYPLLVGKRLRLHPALVFIAVIGGIALFGAAGLVLGPVILSITDALIEIWRRRTADGGSIEACVDG